MKKENHNNRTGGSISKNTRLLLMVIALVVLGAIVFFANESMYKDIQKHNSNQNPNVNITFDNGSESGKDNTVSLNTSQLPLFRAEGWNWNSTSYNDGVENISPTKGKSFNLVLKNDYTFNSTTDCNNIFGKYRFDERGRTIEFYNIGSTRMYCEGSQESVYIKALEDVKAFHFGARGDLILDMKADTGSMIFN